MNRRKQLLPLIALALLALVTLTCNRSSSTPTLVPTVAFSSSTPVVAVTRFVLTVVPSSFTPTPTATPVSTATATPTPTPTPLPGLLIQEAAQARHNGNYAAAQAIYETLALEALDESETATIRLGLAQSLLENGDYAGAVTAARGFLTAHSDHPLAADAYFTLAEALMGQGEYLTAVDAYRAYLDLRDVIAAYVYTWVGDAYTFAEAYDDAADAYRQALAQAPTFDLIFQVREKMGLAYGYAGDYASALAQYDAILAAAESATLRARIQYQAAQTLLIAGERQAAYARLYDLVTNYYKTAPAYDALVDLINSDQPVSEYQRGLVDYYNDAYDAAVAAFYRAVEADPAGHEGALHYFAGLAYRANDNYAAALDEFDTLIATHPNDPYVDDAWLAQAWTYYLAGDDGAAIETYKRFVTDYPGNALAPEALWWAANIYFWNDDYEGGAVLFAQLAADYAWSEYAPDALYRAAFSRYRLGEYRRAQDDWRLYTVGYSAGDLAAGAHFWRGRSYLALGETISATEAFSQAVATGPLDYYSQRALDYLDDLDDPRQPFVERPFDLSPARYDPVVERAAADIWLADGLGLSSTQALTVSQLSPVLAADRRLLRGQELWQLGRRSEAKIELEWLRVDTAADLLSQYQLAIFFGDLGLYRSSILAANAAIRLSPALSPFDAPSFLTRLAYPTHYVDLVLAETEANELDPLLVLALIRQESLFEGFATSYAYAHGLMQIIPSTGRSIASSLGWLGYETDDLYQPFISVKFGTWYLARQRDTFDGRFYPALSAYNAGPGNAGRWLNRTWTACSGEVDPEGCPFDYDSFVEIIHLRETRLYIRQIYKHYSVYQFLYSEQER